jgi:hypothetical protein
MPPEDDALSVDLKYADATAFEAACQRADLRSLVVWNCKVRDFSPLARLTRLRALTVMDFRGPLDVLSGLTALRTLELVHVPQFVGSARTRADRRTAAWPPPGRGRSARVRADPTDLRNYGRPDNAACLIFVPTAMVRRQ